MSHQRSWHTIIPMSLLRFLSRFRKFKTFRAIDLCDEIGGIRSEIRIGEFTQVCIACTGEYSVRVQVCIFQGLVVASKFEPMQ